MPLVRSLAWKPSASVTSAAVGHDGDAPPLDADEAGPVYAATAAADVAESSLADLLPQAASSAALASSERGMKRLMSDLLCP
jgi:hypothetical protein